MKINKQIKIIIIQQERLHNKKHYKICAKVKNSNLCIDPTSNKIIPIGINYLTHIKDIEEIHNLNFEKSFIKTKNKLKAFIKKLKKYKKKGGIL